MSHAPAAHKSLRESLPLREKIAYGLGGGSEILMANVILKLALPVYHLGLGVSASVIGMILMGSKIFDAVSDPVMGSISDNSRLRWGRRKPFVLLGAAFTALFCAVMWRMPDGLDAHALAVYFSVAAIFYYAAYTVFYVPYNALGYEMTDNYDERTRVMTFKWGIGATISLLIIPAVLPLCYWIHPDNAAAGARWVGPVVGVLILALAVPAALLPRERKAAPAGIPFFRALAFTLRNRSMLLLCGIIVCSLVGMLLLVSWMLFLNMAYLQGMNQKASAQMVFWGDLIFSVLNVGFVFVCGWLATRFDKRTILIAGLAWISVGILLSYFYFTPALPYLQLLWTLFLAPGMAAVWVLSNSCIADVCDEDELRTGARREGFYGAVYSFSMKAGAGVGLGLAGVLLDALGFDKALTEQAPQTVSALRLAFAGLPALCFALATALAMLYPITRQRHHEIQQSLLKQNG
ncbi:MAG: MFS transporter [Chthoniobacterales bacterium]|nr:MFS transporter [Chthoniobacterales bacterium]